MNNTFAILSSALIVAGPVFANGYDANEAFSPETVAKIKAAFNEQPVPAFTIVQQSGSPDYDPNEAFPPSYVAKIEAAYYGVTLPNGFKNEAGF